MSNDILYDIAKERTADLHDILTEQFVEYVGGNRYEHRAIAYCECAVARDYWRVRACGREERVG